MRRWLQWWKENTSYKIVGLLVALVLWFTMQTRREMLVFQTYQPEISTSQDMVVSSVYPRVVKVEVAGTRLSLKKYLERPAKLNLDLSQAFVGRHFVRITNDILRLPMGLKVVAVEPSELMIELRSRPPSE